MKENKLSKLFQLNRRQSRLAKGSYSVNVPQKKQVIHNTQKEYFGRIEHSYEGTEDWHSSVYIGIVTNGWSLYNLHFSADCQKGQAMQWRQLKKLRNNGIPSCYSRYTVYNSQINEWSRFRRQEKSHCDKRINFQTCWTSWRLSASTLNSTSPRQSC